MIVFVGNSSLNVAIPTLSRDLHATESQLQWVVAIYSLVFAGLLFTTGALGDRFGRKGALQAGLALFAVGAVLASQADSMDGLIACRALMGVAAALIMPSTLSIIINIFPAHERPKAIAIWASVTGAAGAFGPVISGFLLGHFWFGAIFLINVPIIVVALVAGHFVVPKSRDPEHASFDPLGAVLSTVGIVALVYGLIEAPDHGWGSTATLISFAVAAIVLVAFVLWELHTDEPMLDMHYFRLPAFSTGTGGMILVFLSMYGVMFLISQYFQLVLGYSALGAALRLMPIALIMLVVAPFTPAAQRPVRRAPHGGVRHARHRRRPRALQRPRARHVLRLRGVLRDPAHHRHRALDVADDRVDHGGGPGAARRCGLGDERRHPRARRRARHRHPRAASRRRTTAPRSAPFLRRLSPADQEAARTSLAGALRVAETLPARAGQVLTAAADNAFVGGIHLAVTVGAILATFSAVIVYKFLPHSLVPAGAMTGPGRVPRGGGRARPRRRRARSSPTPRATRSARPPDVRGPASGR